jgi:hypothetical protein
MKPLPPGRFSITKFHLARCSMACASTRAVVSTAPPGANGTNMRTGLLG